MTRTIWSEALQLRLSRGDERKLNMVEPLDRCRAALEHD
jgi:hypothetical protein